MQATAEITDAEQGLASGLVNTSIQIGGAVMLAVTTAVLRSSSSTSEVHDQLLPHMTTAIGVIVVLTVAAVGATLVRIAATRQPAPELAPLT